MDWSNEPYVKVYTRETDDDRALSWEARAVWDRLLLKLDRSGLFETKRGPRGVAAAVLIPADIVLRVLPELLTDGRIREVPAGYFAPNFIPAQESSKSDKLRQKDARDRRRSRNLGHQVTNSDGAVTKRDSGVTDGHAASRGVTPSHSLLCSADPDPLLCSALQDHREDDTHTPPEPPEKKQLPPGIPEPGSGRDPRVQLALDAWRYGALKHSELKGEGIDPTAIGWGITPAGDAWKACKARVEDVLHELPEPIDWGAARDVFRRRVDVAAIEARKNKRLDWFIPIRMWDPKSFAIGSSMSLEQAARSSARAGPRIVRDDDDEVRMIKTFTD